MRCEANIEGGPPRRPEPTRVFRPFSSIGAVLRAELRKRSARPSHPAGASLSHDLLRNRRGPSADRHIVPHCSFSRPPVRLQSTTRPNSRSDNAARKLIGLRSTRGRVPEAKPILYPACTPANSCRRRHCLVVACRGIDQDGFRSATAQSPAMGNRYRTPVPSKRSFGLVGEP